MLSKENAEFALSDNPKRPSVHICSACIEKSKGRGMGVIHQEPKNKGRSSGPLAQSVQTRRAGEHKAFPSFSFVFPS